MSDGVETILIEDDEDDRDFPFSMIPVWINYSGLSNAAYRLYATLRSVSIEGDAKGTRKLLDSDLCELIGRAQGKPITTRTLERWRDELVEHGLLKIDKAPLDRPGVGRPQMTRRYRLVKYPRQGQEVVRSAWTLLKEIQDRREEQHPLPPAEISPTKMSENSEEGGFPTKMSECSTKMSENCGADLRRRGSKNPLREEPSSSPHPSTRLAARKGRGSGRTKKTTKINKDFSHKHLSIAEALVSDLPGSVTGTDHAKLVPLVCAAFDSGWSPSGLSAHLRANCRVDRVQFHGSVYVKHAEDLPPAGKAEASRALVELCSVCDEHGFSLDPAACSKDPEAIPHTCLHGEPDPWDSPEYRAERQAERDEAAHVRLRARQAALREKERRQAREAREAALRAEKEAREAKAVVERRERAQAFLATAPSTGSEVADRVRAVVLAMAADPPETASGQRDELDTVVDLGSGLVEATGEISDLVEIVRTLPRRDWLMTIIDRTDEAEAVKQAKAALEKESVSA